MGDLLYSAYFFKKPVSNPTVKQAPTHKNLFLEYFWIVLFLAFAANVVLHKNITLSNSYIPEDFSPDYTEG